MSRYKNQDFYVRLRLMARKIGHTILISLLFLLGIGEAHGQKLKINTLPEGIYNAYVDGRDTVAIVHLREVFVFPQVKFKNKREQARYNKLVRDVKRTLPYAKMVYETLIETYEYMETLPDDKARQAHLKRMEKDLFREYKPELKKLTFSQGKLLIKLIDRECNQSSYNLLKAYLGTFRAGFWNLFAGMFGASLIKLVGFGFNFTAAELGFLLLGCLVSFGLSIVAIRFLMGYIKQHDFKVFGYYRIVLGGLVLLVSFVQWLFG